MADKKTTAKKTPKAITKVDLTKKTVEELRADLLIAKKGLYDGTLANPHHIKVMKKEIARKLTAENATKEEKGEK